MPKKPLIVMAGIPASGKSTVAAHLADRFGYAVVSTDAIREDLFGDAADQSNGYQVFRTAYNNIRAWLALSYCPGVVFDATNTHRRDRRKVLDETGGMFDVSVCCVCVEPLDVCLQRNASRERVVPDEVIERMFNALSSSMPDASEGFDFVGGPYEVERFLEELGD